MRLATDNRRELVTSSLVRNSGFLMFTTLVTAGLGYVYWIVAAHGYSAHDVGLATGLIAAQALVSLLCCIGIDTALITLLPACDDDGAWSALVNAGLAIGTGVAAVIAAGVGVALAAISSHYSILHRPAVFATFVAGGALGTAGIITDATFVSTRRSGNLLARNFALSVIKLPVMAIPAIALSSPGVEEILLSWVVANAVSLVVALRVQLPRVRPGYRSDRWDGFGVLFAARANVGAHFLTNIGSQVPQFVLPIIVVVAMSAQDNAYFYLAWTVGGIFLFVSPAVAQSLFAEGSNFEDIRENARRSVGLTSALLVPLIVGALLFAHQILGLFGAAYASHGTLLLRVVALAAIPDAVTNIYIAIARVDGRIARAAALNVVMAVVSIGLTAPLIAVAGLAGPGWGWLIAQSVGTLLVVRSVVVAIRRRPAERRPGHGHRGLHRRGEGQRQHAAWYPDPMSGGFGWLRYWDGSAWTGHVRTVFHESVDVDVVSGRAMSGDLPLQVRGPSQYDPPGWKRPA